MQTLLNDITVLFLGILLEALPFVLIGSLIASVIGLFVSDALLYRIIPKNRIGGLVAASLLGLIFPVCDCTIIPVMRRLVRKGLPPSLGVTFMCAVPIINPAVILSTYWAFTNQVQILWLRLLVGIGTAVAAGYIVGKLTAEADPLRGGAAVEPHEHGCGCGKEHDHQDGACGDHGRYDAHAVPRHHECCIANMPEHDHTCCDHFHGHSPPETTRKSGARKIADAASGFCDHTIHEFIDSAALIVIGAFLSAVIQTMVPRIVMYPIATSPFASVARQNVKSKKNDMI